MAAPDIDAHTDPYHRVPLSWEDYLALPDDVPGEYLDGYHLMPPGPDRQHQRASRRMANALEVVLPDGYDVDVEWQWTPRPGINFIPDVMVYPSTDDVVRFIGTPLLIVEVLSTNRMHDLIIKAGRYAALGVQHYWALERSGGELFVNRLVDGHYDLAGVVGDEPVEIDFGIATVTLRVPDLLV